MADLFAANIGLASRFPHKFTFSDYSIDQLCEIATLLMDGQRFVLADEAARDALRRMLEPITREIPCGNARSVESRLEGAIRAQSSRLRVEEAHGRTLDETLLFELVAADFDTAAAVSNRASAVLSQASPQMPNGNC